MVEQAVTGRAIMGELYAARFNYCFGEKADAGK